MLTQTLIDQLRIACANDVAPDTRPATTMAPAA